MKKKLQVFILGLGMMSASPLLAQPLSPEELFYRCYSQLTERRLLASDTRLSLLRNGTKSAADLCSEVLDSASFDSTGQIPDPTNPSKNQAKMVLRTMHNLHNTFFMIRDIEPISGISLTKEMYDAETPGYYYTRALFQPDVLLSSVLTANSHLRAVRKELVPADGLYNKRTEVSFGFFNNMNSALYPPRGELYGVRLENSLPLGQSASGESVDLAQHYGGGILGSNPYLFSVQARREPIRSDLEMLQRGFAKSVMNDFLCREFPVVEVTDLASTWVVPKTSANNPLTFRQSQSCVQCHSSMDRLAGVARNFSYKLLSQATKEGAYFVTQEPVSLPGELGWPSQKDSTFFKRPPKGRLFYRDSFNSLVDLPLTDLTNLGTILESQFDFYLCTASRYYSYFTGVKIKIVPGMFSDTQGTPRGDLFKTQKQRAHAENLFKLASDLKRDKKLGNLIKAIFSLPEYQDADFAVDIVDP